MTISINNNSTITGYSDGKQVVFFKEDAEKVSQVCNLEIQTSHWGIRHLVINEKDSSIYYARLIRAGYKLRLYEG